MDTFIATAFGVTAAGGTPRFADVSADTFNLDPERGEQAITPLTRAIMPVHLFGHPADMDPLLALARKYGLRVIEDAAQAQRIFPEFAARQIRAVAAALKG